MKKLLFLILAVLPCLVSAQKLNEKEYLAGKVPVKDGLVVFEKNISTGSMSQQQAYDKLFSFVNQLISQNENDEYSKVTLQRPDDGLLVANVFEPIYFKRKKWSSDFADMFYRILITCQKGQVSVKIQDITYNYEDDRGLKAERWITDEYALNKEGTKLRRDTGKFRRYTIDWVKRIFEQAEAALK